MFGFREIKKKISFVLLPLCIWCLVACDRMSPDKESVCTEIIQQQTSQSSTTQAPTLPAKEPYQKNGEKLMQDLEQCQSGRLSFSMKMDANKALDFLGVLRDGFDWNLSGKVELSLVCEKDCVGNLEGKLLLAYGEKLRLPVTLLRFFRVDETYYLHIELDGGLLQGHSDIAAEEEELFLFLPETSKEQEAVIKQWLYKNIAKRWDEDILIYDGQRYELLLNGKVLAKILANGILETTKEDILFAYDWTLDLEKKRIALGERFFDASMLPLLAVWQEEYNEHEQRREIILETLMGLLEDAQQELQTEHAKQILQGLCQELSENFDGWEARLQLELKEMPIIQKPDGDFWDILCDIPA